jgi:hypothetical protein
VIPNRVGWCQKVPLIQLVEGDMTNARRYYYDGRERAERSAAECAKSELARDIHLELAERYAALAKQRSRLSLRF